MSQFAQNGVFLFFCENWTYLIFVIFYTWTYFAAWKFYTLMCVKLRQNCLATKHFIDYKLSVDSYIEYKIIDIAIDNSLLSYLLKGIAVNWIDFLNIDLAGL